MVTMLATRPIDENPDRIVALAVAGQTVILREELTEAADRYPFIGANEDLVRAIAQARAVIIDGPPWTGPVDEDPALVLMRCCPHPAADGWGYCEACDCDLSIVETGRDERGFRVIDPLDDDVDEVT